ncbi:MAG TPA: aminotransferase [Jiangellales bacterium]|nr:aminotransferase [Jiangellales bacterium]
MGERFWGDVPPATPVSPEEAVALVRSVFGVEGRARPLGSNQETNLRIDAGDASYVLKVANPAFGPDVLDLQNAAMRHLSAAGVRVPEPVAAPEGDDIVSTDIGGSPHHVRLLTYVVGDLLSDTEHLAIPVLDRFGRLVARAARGLADFDHPAADRPLQYDTRRAAEVVEALAPKVGDASRRTKVLSVSETAWATLAPLVDDLRTQVVHADLADYNVVAGRDGDGRPVPEGIIDFGDVMRCWLVADLATAIASLFARPRSRPVQDACAVAAGYHSELPLTHAEVAALWPLVVARATVLAVSVDDILAADPDNAYAREEQPVDWRILDRVADVPLELADEALRLALGVRMSDRVLQGSGWRPETPVVDLDHEPVRVDLSVRTDLLAEGAWTDTAAVRAAVEGALAGRTGVLVHDEGRLTEVIVDSSEETPTVALGTTLLAPAGTSVRAPTGGSIRAAADGSLVLACGAVDVVLRGIRAAVPAEAEVAQGQVVGEIADVATESRILPHLHVQVVRAPGVLPPPYAEPSLADAWGALCPDPISLLGLSPDLDVGDDAMGVLARRDRVVATVQEHYYARPPQIERGWRQHLVDTRGRAYLDMVNNVAVLGHSHPAVTAAATRQLRLLNTNSRFHYDAVVRFGERITELSPDPLDTVFFVNSGSEAVDLALRLVRTATGRRDVVCLRGGYHGWTTAADEVSTTLNDNPRALETRPPWVHLAPMPNVYRGEHRGPDAAERYAAEVSSVVARIQDGPAGFIAEPLSGNAGGVLVPPGYLPAVYETVRAAGGLCISDEVQVGYGRTGSHFWGFEEHGVVPDVVTMAKAAGNGHPVGFVVTRREVAEAFTAEGSFFSSVGGSPVSSVVGLAVLDTIRDEDLQGNAQRVGGHLRERLRTLVDEHPLVGTVHGEGLYLGVELVRDRSTLEPATAEAFAICERLLELGVITYPTGDFSNVLKVKPPLCITEASADFFVDRLDEVLRSGW